MARKVRNSKLESRSSRLKLQIKGKPHTGPSLGRGIILLYRRNKTGNGSWIVKVADGKNGYWTNRIAEADDFDNSNGNSILTFWEAQEAAKKFARTGDGGTSETAPITVGEALDAYEKQLKLWGNNPRNASTVRNKLPAVLLAKAVSLLKPHELKAWRNGLVDTVKPASANRASCGLRAALNMCADDHPDMIPSRVAWENGLKALRVPASETARPNVILSDDKVREFVAAADRIDPAFGLFVRVLSESGCRPSQARRLRVEDLVRGAAPKLRVP